MRALVYEGPGEVARRELPEPEPAPGEVLVEVRCAGVCGTDRHLVAGELGVAPGTIPGHEIAGRIAALGEGVEGLQVGDRVAVYGSITCGSCPGCVSGRPNRCRRPRVFGMHRPGGFAQAVSVPAANLVAVPDGVTDEIAAIATDAIATPFHALVAVGRLGAGETVAVIGAGGLGLHAVLLARLCGAARVVAVDPSPDARDAALAAGADAALDPSADAAPGRALRAIAPDLTLAVECVGHADTVEWAFDALSPGGRLVVVGIGTDRPRLPPLARFAPSEVSVLGAFGSTPSELRTVLALCATGRLDTSRSVSRHLPLDDGPAALTGPSVAGRTVLLP